jgi:ParE toxin of type II toxin-antitoxin system, parDE
MCITVDGHNRCATFAIGEYVAKDSERDADLTVTRIFSAVERLLQFPHSGRIVPERDEPNIWEIIVGRFRVVYRFVVQQLKWPPFFGLRESSQRNSDP